MQKRLRHVGKSGPKAAGWQAATRRQVRAGKRTARWAHVVGPLARWPVGQAEKRKADGRAADGDTPDGRAGWRAGRGLAGGWQAGGQAGGLAGGRAVFAAMPLKNHVAPAEDLEQGA